MFIVHMAIKKPEKMAVKSKKQAQIKAKAWVGIQAQNEAHVKALLFNKASNKASEK